MGLSNCVDSQTVKPVCDTVGHQHSSLCAFARTQASFAYSGYCQVSFLILWESLSSPLLPPQSHPHRRNASPPVRCVVLTGKHIHLAAMLKAITSLLTMMVPALLSQGLVNSPAPHCYFCVLKMNLSASVFSYGW